MWESTVAQLLLAVRENDKNRISELLEVLNTLIYPVEGVGNKVSLLSRLATAVVPWPHNPEGKGAPG